jgi:hypothetical protein
MKVLFKGLELEIEWSFYIESGEDAICLMDQGEPYIRPTVALWPPSPTARDGQVWLRTWAECEGLPEALEAAGVVRLTDTLEPTGYCEARLAELTDAALADRAAQSDPHKAKAQLAAREKDALTR